MGLQLATFSEGIRPESLFQASLTQLKQVALSIYTSRRNAWYMPQWTLGCLWLVNAILRDPQDPDWEFCFTLFVQSFLRLSQWQRVARIMLQGVLSLAVNQKRINLAQALKIYKMMPKDEDASEQGLEEDAVKMVVDHNRAVVTLQNATASQLSSEFEEMVKREEQAIEQAG